MDKLSGIVHPQVVYFEKGEVVKAVGECGTLKKVRIPGFNFFCL
jgi:hypothetical protein